MFETSDNQCRLAKVHPCGLNMQTMEDSAGSDTVAERAAIDTASDAAATPAAALADEPQSESDEADADDDGWMHGTVMRVLAGAAQASSCWILSAIIGKSRCRCCRCHSAVCESRL